MFCHKNETHWHIKLLLMACNRLLIFHWNSHLHLNYFAPAFLLFSYFFQNQWWLRLPLPPQLKSVAWISCKTPGKSLIHLHHTYIYYHCFFINIIMIAGLPRVWGHRLRRDSFREYMAFYLQGIISISSSDPYQQKYHLQWNHDILPPMWLL